MPKVNFRVLRMRKEICVPFGQHSKIGFPSPCVVHGGTFQCYRQAHARAASPCRCRSNSARHLRHLPPSHPNTTTCRRRCPARLHHHRRDRERGRRKRARERENRSSLMQRKASFPWLVLADIDYQLRCFARKLPMSIKIVILTCIPTAPNNLYGQV